MNRSDPVTDQIPDPADNATLIDVIAQFESAGFTSQFRATEPGLVHCFTCGVESDPGAVELVALRRLEGASDPADMIAVVALRCPACDAAGVLVLGYGPDSVPEDSDVLLRLEDRRAEWRGGAPHHAVALQPQQPPIPAPPGPGDPRPDPVPPPDQPPPGPLPDQPQPPSG